MKKLNTKDDNIKFRRVSKYKENNVEKINNFLNNYVDKEDHDSISIVRLLKK